MEGKSQLQDWNVAAALIKAAASPADFGAQFDLGLAYLVNEMFEEAIEPFERASELRPNSVPTLNNLSVAYTRAGDGAAAELAARTALSMDPDSAGSYQCLGNALRRRGDPHGAIDAYHECLRRQPQDMDTHHNLGLALEEAGRLRDALHEQELVLRWRPRDMLALIQAGKVNEKLSEFDAALRMFRRACEVDPTSTRAWECLGWRLLKLGRQGESPASYEGSVTAFQHVVELDPDSVMGNLNLGAALLLLNRPADALPYAERAHQLAPNSEDAIENLRLARERSSDLEPEPG